MSAAYSLSFQTLARLQTILPERLALIAHLDRQLQEKLQQLDYLRNHYMSLMEQGNGRENSEMEQLYNLITSHEEEVEQLQGQKTSIAENLSSHLDRLCEEYDNHLAHDETKATEKSKEQSVASEKQRNRQRKSRKQKFVSPLVSKLQEMDPAYLQEYVRELQARAQSQLQNQDRSNSKDGESESTVYKVQKEKENSPPSYCICGHRGERYEAMIECEGRECMAQWYHLCCIGMEEGDVPSGEWVCQFCRSKREVVMGFEWEGETVKMVGYGLDK